MDQDRREAAAWAEDWRIRKKNRTLYTVIGVVIALVLLGIGINYAVLRMNRMSFESADAMREAMQGRFSIESSYMDIIIEGDDVTLTYWACSHYDRRYAEEYGYDADEDSVYTDRVVKWDYKRGVMKTEWMGDLVVDRDGNIKRGKYTTFYRTDRPRPEPLDPATLGKGTETLDGNGLSEEDEAAAEEREESLEETQEAAEEAAARGILSMGKGA